MNRVLASLTVVLVLLLAFAPVAARADEASATINALTAEQAIDCLTTLAVLHSGGYERDPLAAPFTHSTVTELGAAVALNLVARRLPLRILRTVVYVYPVVLFGNIRALGMSGPSPGLVPGNVPAAIPWRGKH
jgi:hypothetical protein